MKYNVNEYLKLLLESGDRGFLEQETSQQRGQSQIIKSTRNVGIGTTSPSYKLVVNGSFRVVNESGTEGLFVGQNGNVGIGTTYPQHLLHVQGNLMINSSSLPACSSTTAGLIAYNRTTNKHVGCNSTAWYNLY